MQPDDPRHGTYRGAQQHMRDGEPKCDPCRIAYRRYKTRYANEVKMGKQRTTANGRALAHRDTLVTSGMTLKAIAASAGVCYTTVYDLQDNPFILTATEAAILGVKPVQVPWAFVPATGPRRRVQALNALGWSQEQIVARARDLGHPLTRAGIHSLMHRGDHRVRLRTHQAIAAAYASLSMTLPEPGRSVTWTRNLAERRGYLPPLAWDNIDDPNEQPTQPTSLPTERLTAHIEDLEWMANNDENLTGAATRLGLRPDTLHTICRRANREDIYWRLAGREHNAEQRLAGKKAS